MLKAPTYSSAVAWRSAAMQRDSNIDAVEIQRRQQLATTHNHQKGMHDIDVLNDQALYIQGKMNLEEYQDYLLFKHSQPTA